jgi:hypothetical protein
MSEITLKNINELIDAIDVEQLKDTRFYAWCPNHKSIHSFPAHRERCNVALRRRLAPHISSLTAYDNGGDASA